MSYEAARKDYVKHVLEESDCLESPIEMLESWLHEAVQETEDANAMTLTTVDAMGRPSSRMVLIRKLDQRGVVFYSNYTSKKSLDINENPNVAVNFFWPWLERQVRVEGTVVRLPEAESDAYFKSRPRESQIGAWASTQSEEMTSRDQLEKRAEEFALRFEGQEVPRPEFWGGFIIQPNMFEFWQGRASRLHDRIKYEPFENRWKFKRLFP